MISKAHFGGYKVSKKCYTYYMLKMCYRWRFYLGLCILFSYISIIFYTPVHLMHMTEMTGASIKMSDCPFLAGKQIICSAPISKYAKDWLDFSLLPSKILETTSSLSLLVYFSFALPSLLKSFLYIKRQRNKKLMLWVQSLFSEGILHSKAY